MALQQFLGPTDSVLDGKGDLLIGGKIFFYSPGTSTLITTYTDSSIQNANTNPVVLNGSGRASVWLANDCDIRIEDIDGNLVGSEQNINPDDIAGGSDSGLIANGSFEIDTNSDGTPDGWTLTNETGSSNAIDATTQTDGLNSFRFTSAGSGGGDLITDDFFAVNDVDNLVVQFDLRSSVANVQNIVQVQWFDAAQAALSTTDAYNNSASNPTSFTNYSIEVVPPATARFAKLKIIGCDPAVATAGSTWFDKLRVFYPLALAGVFDNVRIQNNQIITTNTNGDLEIAPNGTGSVNVNQAAAVDLANTNNALNLGTNNPDASPHLALSLNQLQAKADAATTTTLNIQPLGGLTRIGAQTETGLVEIYTNGTRRAQFAASGIVDLFGIDNTDTSTRLLRLMHANGTLRAFFGHNSSGELQLRNFVHGGMLSLRAEDSLGFSRALLFGDPDGSLLGYHPATGGVAWESAINGLDIRNQTAGTDTTNINIKDNIGLLLATIGTVAGQGLVFRSLVHGDLVLIQGEDSLGVRQNILAGNPDDSCELSFAGVDTAKTAAASDGGLLVKNEKTSDGYERPVTESEIGAAISNYNKGVAQYFHGEGGNATAFQVTLAAPSNTIETIGPTGATADNIWSALDDLPVGANAVYLSVYMSGGLNTDIAALDFYMASGDAALNLGDRQRVATLNGDKSAGNSLITLGCVWVPLDSSRRLKFRYLAFEIVNPNIYMHLKGFSFAK